MENDLYWNAKACNRKGIRDPGGYKSLDWHAMSIKTRKKKINKSNYERVRSPTNCVRKEHSTVEVRRREAKVTRDKRNAPRTRND